MNFEIKCPTCGKLAHTPYRRLVGGEFVEGCVDDFHTGHLVPCSGSSHWHSRKEAQAIRKASRDRLKNRAGK